MIELKTCTRDNWCSECDDSECLHAGDAAADCPRYKCIHDIGDYMDCENCDWLYDYKKECEKNK